MHPELKSSLPSVPDLFGARLLTQRSYHQLKVNPESYSKSNSRGVSETGEETLKRQRYRNVLSRSQTIKSRLGTKGSCQGASTLPRALRSEEHTSELQS